MRTCLPLLSLLSVPLGLYAPVAWAEVYQCAGPAGAMLLTDSGCPPGYQTRFIAREARREAAPRLNPEPPSVPEPAAKPEWQRAAAAEAEAVLLRLQLETERLRLELVQEQLKAAERDALADPAFGYSVIGPVVVPVLPRHPPRHGKHGKPCLDCRPPPLGQPVKMVPPDDRRDCGMFGCTPRITHATWDDVPRARTMAPRQRAERIGVLPRRDIRPAAATRPRL